MTEKNEQGPDRQIPDNVPSKEKGDRIEKGQQGIIPPKPIPQGPREGDLSEGVSGWTPPKTSD